MNFISMREGKGGGVIIVLNHCIQSEIKILF